MYENEQLKYHCLVTANHDHHKDQAEEKGVKASHILILKCYIWKVKGPRQLGGFNLNEYYRFIVIFILGMCGT